MGVYALNQQRREQEFFYYLVAELRLDSQCHHQYFQMTVKLIVPKLTRQSTNYKAAIEHGKPAVGLR